MSTEILDGYLSVFNNHVNNADQKARAVMRQLCPAFLEQVEDIEKEGNGIMAIFQQSPSAATAYYVAMVQYFVNEDKVELPSSVISVEVPQYDHDCEHCTFLGNYEVTGCRYDLYHCERGHVTVIARYSSDAHEYISGLEAAKSNMEPALAEALRRAKEQGLNVD